MLLAIYVGKNGIELVLEIPSDDGAGHLVCRLDRSVSHANQMLLLAETAMLNKLKVSLLGYGDDRDDTLEYHEIRISRDSELL